MMKLFFPTELRNFFRFLVILFKADLFKIFISIDYQNIKTTILVKKEEGKEKTQDEKNLVRLIFDLFIFKYSKSVEHERHKLGEANET